MKIRQRLALRFTIVSALLTGAILTLIYVLTQGFVHADFVERLTRQSSLEALHYATPHVREVLPSGSFLLVNPITAIYSAEGTLLHAQGNYPIPEAWVSFVKEHAAFNAERGEYTTVGRRYDINGERYLVFVSDKDLPGQRELDILIKAVLMGWLVSLLLSYLAGLYFSGNAMQPVNHVVKEVNQITQDNLGYRLKVNKEPSKLDEIDELVITFNALLNRIESAFITQKRFVQHASHELKTPLTAIMAETELALAKTRHPQEYERTLQVIAQEAERLERITQGLLTLARMEEGAFKPELDEVKVCTLLEQTLNTFRLHHPEREVVKQGETTEATVRGNAQLLQIAILNILDNAVKYSSGKIMVRIGSNMRELSLAVEDSGIGIPAAELGRIRSPLFRGSNASVVQGAGLGLSLADRVVKVHAGQLDIMSEEGNGTTCTITLPLAGG